MGLDFSKLAYLRLRCKQILEDQAASIKYFAHNEGFEHYKGVNHISVSSSATCVLSLVATRRWEWEANRTQTNALLRRLIPRKTSASLPKENPFTLAWILEAVNALRPYSDPLKPSASARVGQMEKILQGRLKDGSVTIEKYPPTAYLTQLVVRVLLRRSKLTNKLKEKVKSWAWGQLPHQIGLVKANSKFADAFAIAYLVMLVTAVTPRDETTPDRTLIQRMGLKTFFDCQRDDGTWPLSRPLFHYEKFGNAYCYEYEMLTQLLSEPKLNELLLDYQPNLSAAMDSVARSAYSVKEAVQVWTSGHHPQLSVPESWATASVYHFVHRLDRLLAEAVRRDLFKYMDRPFPEPAIREGRDTFAKTTLDSRVTVRGKKHSLKKFLFKNFVKPISEETGGLEEGSILKKGTPRSAIFFGPPGTSKTELSKKIAEFIGWPHLAVDPSFLLRNGMEGIQAEANTIFRMLEETERVVVLFDEFDEFVREREKPDAEQFSRFLTTAMLPKLASIHKRATLVFIIATNNIQQFDLAIRRPGRFDRVVQIMPPILEAKMKKRDWGSKENIDIGQKLRALSVKMNPHVRKLLGALTYGECDAFATDLAAAQDSKEALKMLDGHSERCILRSSVGQKKDDTWEKRCIAEAKYNS